MAKIAILTNFMDFNPGYSLTGIVFDQCLMLQKYGHEVHVFVQEQFNSKVGLDFTNPAGDGYNPLDPTGKEDRHPVTLHKKVPFAHLKDYASKSEISDDHKEYVEVLKIFLKSDMAEFDYVFTHDWIFTGWNMPLALAMQGLRGDEDLKHIRWLHWVHSVPSGMRDWWDIRSYGNHHKIVFPNSYHRQLVAEQFRGSASNVAVIPHIKDLRTWWDFHEDTRDFIDDFPGVMQKDMVCIYPASTDRLEAKRLDVVIKILSHVKRMGYSVCLVCANQWATGRNRKEDVEQYYKVAHRNGLRRDEEFIFTSEWREKYATGIPKRMLRELFLCANVFIFPTREESFGLISPEAGLSGAKVLMLNKSLGSQLEVNGFTGLYADFGSFHNTFVPANEAQYLHDLAVILLGRMKENDAVNSATFYRIQYNYDHVYNRHYAPILGGSALW